MFRRVLVPIRRRPVAFVALLFALEGGATAAPSLADTTIGQTGGTNDCLVGPVTLADTNYVVPSGRGWITSFSFFDTQVLPLRPPEPLRLGMGHSLPPAERCLAAASDHSGSIKGRTVGHLPNTVSAR